jgi:hypothetical protein
MIPFDAMVHQNLYRRSESIEADVLAEVQKEAWPSRAGQEQPAAMFGTEG